MPFPPIRLVSRRYYAPRSLSAGWKWFGIPTSLGVACIALVKLQRTLRGSANGDKLEESSTWQVGHGFTVYMFRQAPSTAFFVPTTLNSRAVSYVGRSSTSRDTNMAAKASSWLLRVGLRL